MVSFSFILLFLLFLPIFEVWNEGDEGRYRLTNLLQGRTFAIVPSGVIDMEEDHEKGYGGAKWTAMLEEEGFTKLENLFPSQGTN